MKKKLLKKINWTHSIKILYLPENLTQQTSSNKATLVIYKKFIKGINIVSNISVN